MKPTDATNARSMVTLPVSVPTKRRRMIRETLMEKKRKRKVVMMKKTKLKLRSLSKKKTSTSFQKTQIYQKSTN